MESARQPIEPGASGVRFPRWLDGPLRWLDDPVHAGGLLLGIALLLRLVWLDKPYHLPIFDEVYYVNAARAILGLPISASAHYFGSPAGFDPNHEHPPLGKLLIAGSMALFGDNPIGWRLPTVVAAMVALLATWRIVREADRDAWLGPLVVVLVAFDNLTFVHGRIGMLDMLALAPVLVGSWLAMRRRWLLAGLAVGIGLLVKLTALYAVGAIVLYVVLTDGATWWRSRRIPWSDLAGPAAFVIFAFAFALAGLGILDSRFSTVINPLDHIRQMIGYGAALTVPATPGICTAADSGPLQWLFNECQIEYLRLGSSVTNGGVVTNVAKVDFRGAMNPVLVGAIPLAALFTGWYAVRTRNRLAIWAVAWGAANYVPYLLLAAFTARVMYLYYVLPLIPAVAVGIALLLTRAGLPRPLRWGFLAAYLVGFVAYFPFRQVP